MKKGDIKKALVKLEEGNVEALIKEGLQSGIEPNSILIELQEGLNEIGVLFEKGEMYVPELIFAGNIMKKNMELLKPLLKSGFIGGKGKIILGTVFGDVHDIGKDIVKTLLEGSGYEVLDLGTNVEPERFVDSIRESGARIVGLSALLTISFESIANTVEAIKKAGYRDLVKIMVGGAPVTDLVAKKTGCDFYGKDAYEGLKYANKVYGHTN